MSLWESFITAWRALLTNKLRSALTMLGIIIGVSAVVFVVSLGKGHQANVTAIFEAMGANAIYITSATTMTQGFMTQGLAGGTGSLTVEDAEALADPIRAPSIAVVAPIIEKMANVVFGNENTTVNIIGLTPEIQHVISYQVANGVFISEDDVKKRANVAVLGSKTASDLFGSASPLGETIRISGRNFQVIGVLEKMGDSWVALPTIW